MQSSHCCLVAFALRMQSDASLNHIRLEEHALPNDYPLCSSTSTEIPLVTLARQHHRVLRRRTACVLQL